MAYDNSSCSILLVEDNSSDIELIKRAIQKADVNVQLELARDGDQALARVKSWEAGAPAPIVILLDLKLPGVDGLQVLRALKTHPLYRRVPVVVLSASGEGRQLDEAYKLGANSYVQKSIEYDEFAKAVVLIRRYWCELNVRPG